MSRVKNLSRVLQFFFVIVCLCLLWSSPPSWASDTMQLNYKDADIVHVIIDLGKKFHKNFIVDPAVRGKITVQTNVPVSEDEAYEALMVALQLNGLTTVPHGSYLKVMQAQNAQRSDLPTFSDNIPSDVHEGMVSITFHLKHAQAREVYNILGPILNSRLGELRTFEDANILICSDYVGNIRRMKKIIDEVDVPAHPKGR